MSISKYRVAPIIFLLFVNNGNNLIVSILQKFDYNFLKLKINQRKNEMLKKYLVQTHLQMTVFNYKK